MKFLQIKLTFLFLLKECILCHAVFDRHYPLYFFAQWGTVLGPQLSEYLENGQIRNLSAIVFHVEVRVKSISCYYTSLPLKCFLSVLCGRREGRLKQKEKSLFFKTKTWFYHTEVWTCPVYGKSLGPHCQCWEPWDKPASTPEYLQEEVGSTAAPLPAPLLVMNFFPKVPIVSQSPSNLQNYSFLLSAFHLICFWDKNHLSNTNT